MIVEGGGRAAVSMAMPGGGFVGSEGGTVKMDGGNHR